MQKRRRLNSILHPAIRWEMFMQTLKYLLFGTHYIVLDTPLLFESGYHKFLGTVIVVWCDEETEFKRLMLRDGLSKDEAVSRVAAQFPIRRKMEMATVLIDNNGTREDLRAKVLRFHCLFRSSRERGGRAIFRTTFISSKRGAVLRA
ncbi:unnamed protein product [Heligmosomoides polygyrus]|uniref:Dephospho-CoA kinase n=1 Tax=Heligmosomoides polygyrus TaxID=6339 RepID=A0A3P7X9J1_HELPZ|nr:unnamed protein product [Heligmosomoides polygyrus]